MNALAHGADSLYTPLADEASRAAALRGAELIAEALDQAPDARDRAALSLGALLCGLAVDRAGIALHHVIGQSAVRVLGTPTPRPTPPSSRTRWRRCAIALPSGSTPWRRPSAPIPRGIRERIADLAGHRRLGELGADRDRFDQLLDVAMARPELGHMTPGEVDRSDLASILDASW